MRFCGGCGGALPHRLPLESESEPPGAAPGATSRSSVPPDNAERRQTTVMFCDLVGSVQLSETLDAEELRELVRAYQTISTQVIQRHGGYVAQYLGDGILVYFGFPTAHEDDAERAVRTGLEIIDAIAKANTEQELPAAISVRVSAHTGLGVAGEVGGGGRQELLVIGSAPNVASRLNAISEPDQLIVSDDTKRIVEGLFEFEALPPLKLKGIARQFQAHRVLSPAKLRRRFDVLVRRGLGPLVGREQELLTLGAGAEQARRAEGQTIFVNGEAGIGKSRLLHALASEVADTMTVLTAHCSAYSQNSAFLPLLEIYEQLFDLDRRGRGAEHLTEALARSGFSPSEAIPLLTSFLALDTSDAYPAPEPAGPKQRERLLDLLVRLLVAESAQRPILMAIEDLHWADPSTLEFIDSLIDAAATARLLLLLTARPTFKPPWGFRPYLTRLELSRLPEDSINRIIDTVTKGKHLPYEVRRQLLARCDGVPLFVEEMTKAVVDSNLLVQSDAGYELNLPMTLRDSLTSRLDRLEAAKEVAQLASVIGRRFSYEILSAVSPLEDRLLRRYLDRLVGAELVFREETSGPESYAFKHALIQEAAYDSLLRKTRQGFHQVIAETLSDRFPELGKTQPELLARHFEGAGLPTQAVEYRLQAGALAQQRSANFECVAHMRRALAHIEALPAGTPRAREAEMTAQLALGPALMATQGWASPEVEAACSRARELCEAAQNNEGLLAALWGLWTVRFVRGEHRQALEAAEPVLAMANRTDNPILRTVAHHGVGFTRYFMGDFQLAREHGERGVEGLELERERQLVGMFQLSSSVACLTFLAQSLWFLGYPEQAEARQREAFELCRALAKPFSTAYALGVGLYLPYAKRDTDALRTLSEECRSISDLEGFPVWSAQARFYAGFVQVLSGDPERGLDEMKAGWEAFRGTGSNVQATQWWLMQAEALHRASRDADSLAALQMGARHAEQHGEHAFEPELYRLEGEILIRRGSLEDGERRLRRSLALAKAQSAKMLELRSAVSLGRSLAERGHREEARALLAPIYAHFTEGFSSVDLREARALLESIA